MITHAPERKTIAKMPAKASDVTVTVFSNDSLPLAPNTLGLNRPLFHTTHFAFSIGLLISDFSSLGALSVSASSVCMPVSCYLEIPFAEDPLISIVGGGGFALGGASGGSLSTFSAFLIYRTGTSAFSPFVGFGAARTSYNYSVISSNNNYSSNTNLAIDAGASYGMLIGGICLVPDRVDLLLSLPLGSGITTHFESKAYTIGPAIFQVSFLASL